MRAEVLKGQARPEGLGAIVYHGMVAGLLMLTRPAARPVPLPDAAARAVSHDGQFVRLLANMLLQIQSEIVHVY